MIAGGILMKLIRQLGSTILTNDQYEVRIQKKIFGGYSFKKYIINSPFDLLETREVRLDISEDEAIELGKELLEKKYRTAKQFKNLNYIPG